MTTTLAYQSFGQNHPQTILFLHGGGAAGWTWQPVVDLLSDSFHCLVPDLPQHGASLDVTPFTIETTADLVAALIRDSAHDGKAIIVGLSEGAQVGVSLLARYPHLITSAVLSGVLSHPMSGSRWMTPTLLKWSYRWFVAPFQNSDWYIRLNMRSAVGIPDGYFDLFKADFQALTADAWVNMMTANQEFRLPNGLDQFTAPVLVLTGEKEYKVMKLSARDLTTVLPNAQLAEVLLPGKVSLAQSHNWPLNAPALCTNTIRAWAHGEKLPDGVKTGQSTN